MAEERILNETRFLQTQKIAHIGTYEYNLKTNELWWSDELYNIYGIRDKSGMEHGRFMEFVHPDDRDRLKVMQDLEKEDYHIEYRIIRADGEVRYISTFVGKHEYMDGERYLIRGTAQDITEHKVIEQERNRLEVQLHQAQKMETIGTLAGGIAHDINNILGIIIGNTELSMDEIKDDSSIYANLQEIMRAGLRAKEVISQLLTFSRSTELKRQPVDIIEIIKEALKFLRATISATIDIETDIRVTRPYIEADPTQIYQIFMNICSNSAQAMEERGGVLSISIEDFKSKHPFRAGADYLPEGEYIKITINDTGPGIAPEIQEKIFDPYFTTKETGKGSGMGLAVVHGIIKKHKGIIRCSSAPGKGTSFIIYLPCSAGSEEPKSIVNPYPFKGTGNILFIDDEESITKVGYRILEGLGFSVVAEINPYNALEIFRVNSEKFDLIITDMAMPQMNGISFFNKITEIRKNIPVILCSGHNPLIDEKKAEETGFAGYILKPFTKKELVDTVYRVLSEY